MTQTPPPSDPDLARPAASPPASPRVLVDAVTLADELAGAVPPLLLDVRWRLGGPPGLEEFAAGHVPGAVYADLDTQLASPAAPGLGRHPLPDPAVLQAAARAWGLTAGRPVVAYDDVSGLSAARAWWLLRWAGVDDVRILDGGLAAWRAAGGALATGPATPVPSQITLSAGRAPVLEVDDVEAFTAAGGLLLDARSADRYRGDATSIDPVPGHVPGAVSAPTTENLDAAGRFRRPDDLAERFAALGVAPGRAVGVYCGSGVTAAHEIAALALAGVHDVVLYPGSWSQWATQPGRPVASGPAPDGPRSVVPPTGG